ncbi:MAG: hypothetical protein GY847_41590 [Proteobacteria bacterium]|nr:hypothetical protein [Pseudomonadota bacterium]
MQNEEIKKLVWPIAVVTLLTIIGCNKPGSSVTDAGPVDTDKDTDTDKDSKFKDCEMPEQNAGCFAVDEIGINAALFGGAATISVPITSDTEDEVSGRMEVWLRDLKDKVQGKASRDFISTELQQLVDIEINGLPEDLETADLAGYVVDYKVSCGDQWTNGRRSLFTTVPKTRAVLRGPDELLAGTTNRIRLYAEDASTNQALKDVSATFHLKWKQDTQEQSLDLFTGQTDELGNLEASFDIPDNLSGSAILTVDVNDSGSIQVISAPVEVTRAQNILLTSDKPLYQPGQTIHIRSLSLRRPDLTPESKAEAIFEVIDSKGNKVFRSAETTDDFGISSAVFKLASEVLLGAYTLRVTVGDTTVEKSITVDRYTLPKFGISVETDREFYRPGATLSGSIDAQYFFGQPVAGADVTITAQKFDLDFATFEVVSGQTNQEGRLDFQLELPTHFVGQPLDNGNALVLLLIDVVDTAKQSRVVKTTRPVVETAILPQVVPESGDVVQGIENVFYLLTTDPRGVPIPTQNKVTVNQATITVDANDFGIATFSALPPNTGDLSISVTSDDGQGNKASREFKFTTGAEGAYVLLRTDKPVYKVGDIAEITIHCPDYEQAATSFKDRVYLDVIKDGRTTLMTTVELDEGVGTHELTVTPDLTGGFEIEAYYLNMNSLIMRDRKLIYADPASALQIDVSADMDVYAPADEARLTFAVTDSEGLPVPSAIGLQIVDEAVYSLMEFKPGLEKVFYALEEEILSPKYEIHGYHMSDVINDNPKESENRRQGAAEVLFAAAGGGSFGISHDTYPEMLSTAMQLAQQQINKDVAAIRSNLNNLCRDGTIKSTQDAHIYLEATPHCWLDPWNAPYAKKTAGPDSSFKFESPGPDEEWSTSDDQSSEFYFSCYTDSDIDTDSDTDSDTDTDTDSDGDTDSDDDGDLPRVRKNFPETLYVNPALITDGQGQANLVVPLADSITTWRMTALASSKTGLLGSTESSITVFQDFFVDIDFPAALTQDDEIAVPIAIYNYLDVAQSVTLSVETADWFDLLDTNDKIIELGPGEVLGASFLIKVNDVGWHSFTVYGQGNTLSDAVARTVEIVPNGKEILANESGRLDETVEHVSVIPETAIDDASKIIVKIYPGMLSQAVEGLDSMLQMPSGCFEQTSSATYPNVLVLDYLMSTGQNTPEIELKAREYINLGYQRLLTFECTGGGFEWFGGTPAHNILTAYGLLEFYDMSKVHPVDPAIITRTQEWLAGQQKADGHFEPTHGGIAEGAINAYEDDVARTTAYLTYALIETGYTGQETADGIAWLKSHYEDISDGYGLAMFANALVALDEDDPVASTLLDKLHEMSIVDDDGIHWNGSGESTTYGNGEVMSIETTALVGYAMLRAGKYPNDVEGAINYLIGNKDSLGNWHTTQATVLTFRLLLASLKTASDPGPATIRIYAHDELQETLDIDESNSDVLRLVDLGDITIEGNNPIRIEIDGDSSYMYQIITRYYAPWGSDEGSTNQGPLSININYDKTALEVDDIVSADVIVTNNIADSVAKMVLVDIGLPPGFDLITDNLRDSVSQGKLQKFEKTKRQLILYIEAIPADEPLTLNYQLKAKYPISASSGEAEVHPYYEPDQSTQLEPVEFVVN